MAHEDRELAHRTLAKLEAMRGTAPREEEVLRIVSDLRPKHSIIRSSESSITPKRHDAWIAACVLATKLEAPADVRETLDDALAKAIATTRTWWEELA